ncbi:aldehyde dehydrogenase [Arthrobacter sp. 18067]|uniref:aldehyde dehydrogenase n=1 Tax=Arthrobacter sp. 18067 TaxID=2681413 RepID=UPI00135738F2|nr:aldehyde dehydrogenase [Arthrobacter sp. 18067]
MTTVTGTSVPLTHLDAFYIGGEWVRPSSEDSVDVIHPATEDVYATVPFARESDMNRAVAAAREAFDNGPWPRLTHKERAGYMRAMADELRRRTDDLAGIWASEMGILHVDAVTRGARIPGIYETYAGFADTFDWTERHEPAGGGFGMLLREPVGVVGAIIPWNAAIVAMSFKIAPALIAGCTVVLKSAPEAPVSAYLLAEVAHSVGLPPGVLNIVTADREVSELLVRNRGIDKISFTGSTVAGKKIAEICAQRVARVNLELGGKSAALVLDDYDIATAAASLAGSATELTGQVCSALTRVVVSRHRHDELVEALSAEFAKVRVGNQFDANSDMGPIAMKRQLDMVNRIVAQGVEQGATLAAGGRRPEGLDRGYFIEPTVLGNVDNQSVVASDEIFGPVLSVIPADNEQDQIRIANDSRYGLNAAVFTNDEERAWEFARQIRSGTVGHNAHRNSHAIAFGGFKESGIGREGGREGLIPYTETKVIILDREPKNAI